MNKKELRKKYTQIRNNIIDKKEKDEKIKTRLEELEIYKKAKTIFIFISFRSEIDTIEIIKDMLKGGKKVLVPKVVGKEMVAVEIKSLEGLEKNKMGILEPITTKGETEIDLTITPGLVFDKRGYRIGYGGGYYDKFFEKVKTISLAIAYSAQIIEKLEIEKFDKRVDYLLTEDMYMEF